MCVRVSMYMLACVHKTYTATHIRTYVGSLRRAGVRILGNWFYRLLRVGRRFYSAKVTKTRKRTVKKMVFFLSLADYTSCRAPGERAHDV